MKIVVTGGATRNKVDAIRYMSAHATGKTAVDLVCRISDALAGSKRDIRFLGSAEAILRMEAASSRVPCEVSANEEFFGTRDLMERMMRHVPGADVVIHSAAVGDYEWDTTDAKIPSGQVEVTIKGRPAPKILDLVRGWNPGCLLVSFKAASPGTTPAQLIQIANAQIKRTGSDFVFANVIGDIDQVMLVSPSGVLTCARPLAIVALAEAVQKRGTAAR